MKEMLYYPYSDTYDVRLPNGELIGSVQAFILGKLYENPMNGKEFRLFTKLSLPSKFKRLREKGLIKTSENDTHSLTDLGVEAVIYLQMIGVLKYETS